MTPLVLCGCVRQEGEDTLLFAFLLVNNNCVVRMHQNSWKSSLVPLQLLFCFLRQNAACPLESLSPHSPLASVFQAFKHFLECVIEKTGRLNMIKEAL